MERKSPLTLVSEISGILALIVGVIGIVLTVYYAPALGKPSDSRASGQEVSSQPTAPAVPTKSSPSQPTVSHTGSPKNS
jgi:hypothetical protein